MYETKTMYKIDKTNNRICPIEARSFSEMGFREREHLQEWLANQPEALGEELLIIQKEFDGFDDTKERLDLLALDKNGQLVLIENKLDDSGRDVVWQALKYAAYCSSLKSSQIVGIFKSYLNTYYEGQGTSAEERICEFLDCTDLSETILNEGSSQRIILVAANFRKEVTSTVLWLLNHGISMKCIKVTPFMLEEDLILDVQQIIPPPEAQEFMIGLSDKDKSEASAKNSQNKSQKLRKAFWTATLPELRSAGLAAYENINPTGDSWINSQTGLFGVRYTLIIGTKEIRVELNIESGSKEYNKVVFDSLVEKKKEIEEKFGSPLIWLRLDENKKSRVSYTREINGFSEENWNSMINWMIQYRSKIEIAFCEYLQSLQRSEQDVLRNKI